MHIASRRYKEATDYYPIVEDDVRTACSVG